MQVVKPFVWAFRDSNSMLLASLLLLLLFSDMPFLGAAVPFCLLRTTRVRWLLGQVLYICIATFLYMLFVMVFSIIICAKNAFPGNMWRKAGAILGFSQAGKTIAVPSSIARAKKILIKPDFVSLYLEEAEKTSPCA